MLTDFFSFEFLRNALIAGFFVSVACGVIGPLIVVNRLVFISGGIAHASYGGIGLALLLGVTPFFGALSFALAVSLLMGSVMLKNKSRADSIIGVIWAIGMAVGIICIDLTPGFSSDAMSYLFGSIMTVPKSDLWIMLGMDCGIIAFCVVWYKQLLALSYDEQFAQLRGVPVRKLYIALLAVSAVAIVMSISVVGMILVIALVTIPTFIAERFVRSLGMMMFASFATGFFFILCGLVLSYRMNLTPGATIILVAGGGFLLSLLLPGKNKGGVV